MENGLNGKFRDFLNRMVGKAVDMLSSQINGATLGVFSETLNSLADSVKSYINFREGVASDLTSQEELLLSNWMSNRFTPYYGSLLMQAEAAFTGEELNFQKAKINLVLAKCSIIREYFYLNETAGLSEAAIKNRSAIIELFLSKLEQSVIVRMGIFDDETIERTASQTEFTALFKVSVQGQKYQVNYYNFNAKTGGGQGANSEIIPGSNFGPPRPFEPTVLVPTFPNPSPKPTDPKKAIIDQPVSEDPATIYPTTVVEVKQKLHWLTWILGGIAVYGFVDKVILSKKK